MQELYNLNSRSPLHEVQRGAHLWRVADIEAVVG